MEQQSAQSLAHTSPGALTLITLNVRIWMKSNQHHLTMPITQANTDRVKPAFCVVPEWGLAPPLPSYTRNPFLIREQNVRAGCIARWPRNSPGPVAEYKLPTPFTNFEENINTPTRVQHIKNLYEIYYSNINTTQPQRLAQSHKRIICCILYPYKGYDVVRS